ncbi:MAG: hypothetical protein RML36_10275 [Anaerolineae bacterium]|nr:hypothetical protein [Anaerolineae bacterium]MDW8099852.1 hypothetical protein [Anaerolineae bacterium]
MHSIMKACLSRAHRFEWRRLWLWVGIGLTGGCLSAIGVIVYRERVVLVQYIQAADVTHLPKTLGWYTAALAIHVIAWASILDNLGNRIRFLDHLWIFCLSNAAKRLPGTLWYLGGRAVLYARKGVPIRSVMLASGIEAALIGLSGILVAVLFLLASRSDLGGLWTSIGAVLVCGALNPWTLRRIGGYAARRDMHFPVKLWYLWIALYAASWVMGGFLLSSVLSVFQPISLGQRLAIIGIWALSGVLSMLVIIFPSNLGVMEISLTTLLSAMVPIGLATLAAISMRVLTTVLDLLWGGLAVLLSRASTSD